MFASGLRNKVFLVFLLFFFGEVTISIDIFSCFVLLCFLICSWFYKFNPVLSHSTVSPALLYILNLSYFIFEAGITRSLMAQASLKLCSSHAPAWQSAGWPCALPCLHSVLSCSHILCH